MPNYYNTAVPAMPVAGYTGQAYNTAINPYQQMQRTYPYQTMPAQQPTNTSGIEWVQGEAGAKGRFVPPNSTALLMDSESQNFYIKTTDASGMPQPLRKFKYEEVFDEAPATMPGSYSGKEQEADYKVSSEDFLTKDEFSKKMDELMGMIQSIANRVEGGTAGGNLK